MEPIFAGIGAIIIILLFALLMRTKRFYLIRHGETILNSQGIRQGEPGSLSEMGRQEAKEVGRYLAKLHIERIVSSTYPRAEETAEIINTALKVPVVYTPLLAERRNPSAVIGKYKKNPEVVRIIDAIDLAFHDDDYRYSDEENFADLKVRAKRCLRFLARQDAQRICVVTHHKFLKILLAYMLYHKQLHAADFAKLAFFNYLDNAGVTVCEFNPWAFFSRTRGWKIITFNEIIT